MENNHFEQKVRSIDWVKYLNPKFHDSSKMDFYPDKIIETLIKLNQVNKSEDESTISIDREVRFAIGNDHQGTYYPAALEAIDLIIEIEKTSTNEFSRKYAKYVLNDLHYFKLEMRDGDQVLYNSISNSIKEKLEPYSDESLEIRV